MVSSIPLYGSARSGVVFASKSIPIVELSFTLPEYQKWKCNQKRWFALRQMRGA
jgi:hypothetical protein